MTTATEANAVTGTNAYDDSTDPTGVCWDCGGPCLTYKGSDHGWRCRACVDAYLDEGAARWACRSEKAREKITRNLLHGNNDRTPVTANGQRRDGGGQQLCAAPPSRRRPTATDHQGERPLPREG